MMFDKERSNGKTETVRPGPHEFGRPPMHGMHGSHPALHMRNEQQGRLFHGEEGQQVRRTIDRDLKPGPVPGMRPTMGGPGIPQAPRTNQGGGTMGILMPIYTTGIVIFFVYTVMKIMMKKNDQSTDNALDDPNRRLHQQLRSQAITPEFIQHQQLVAAAAKAAKVAQPIPQPSMVEKPPVIPAKIIPKVEETIISQETKEKITEEPTPIISEKIEKIEPKHEIKKQENVTSSDDPRDEQIRILKERLEETEKAMKMIVTHMAAITTQMPKPAPTKNEELLDSEPIKTETIHEKSSNSIVENETVVNEKANSCGLSDANIDAKKQMPNELPQENGDNEADSETDDDDEDLDEEKVTKQDENVEKIENLNAIPLPAQET